MAEKIPADELRGKSIKEIQRIINDQKKKKKKVLYGQMGGQRNPQPSESVGTIKKNIARCKTIMNERLSENN